jgi:hypothetical protein
MNNYSWLQQKIHQLALSSKFMREAAFDFETYLTSTEQPTNNHVFVSGLARSGTTILLNALHESSEFASLSYRDMPFVLAPNLWAKLSFNKKNNNSFERAHGDGIRVSAESPEAFEEVFWMTFDEYDIDTEETFKRYVHFINNRYQRNRYLSKNNQNIKRLKLISKIFPNSKILIPFRNPIQTAYSLLFQHQRFIELSKKDTFISDYMKLIGHSEFGPNYVPIYNKNLRFIDDLSVNHWLEQWYLNYRNCLETYKNTDNIYFICYEQLCYSKEYWIDLLQILDIKETYDFKFKESHKDISIQVDHDISTKGLSLYSELLHYHFKN